MFVCVLLVKAAFRLLACNWAAPMWKWRFVKNSYFCDREYGGGEGENMNNSLWRREQRRTAAFNHLGLTSWGMSQNSRHCFPTQITQMILQIEFSYFTGCEWQLSFCGIPSKKLCVLIAPPAHQDRKTSVDGGAKNGVEWRFVIPAEELERRCSQGQGHEPKLVPLRPC